MSDGPLDHSSGYIFESQKGISDRRAARGFPSGYDAGRGGGSTRGGEVAGGTLGDFIFKIVVFLMVAGAIVAVAASIAIMVAGAWLLYHLVRAIWRSRR
jgi:hypothetical protein